MKKLLVTILLVLLYSVSVSSVEAHRDGCHAAHSCPSDSGSYVCGDTGNSSECGGSAPANSAPVQNAPVIAAPTTAPVKQYIAPVVAIPTKVPTLAPTAIPTIRPTAKPTAEPTKKIAPTPKVAGENSDGNPLVGFITLGILGWLGYKGVKKVKNRKSSV